MTLGPIDPAAEPISSAPTAVTGEEERTWFAANALDQRRLSLGLLGKVFGSADTAPTSIAGLVIVVSVLALAASFWGPASPEAMEIRKTLKELAILALGYLFGAGGSPDGHPNCSTCGHPKMLHLRGGVAA